MRQSNTPPTYIWQHESWPHLTWNSYALMTPLNNAVNKYGILRGQLSTLGLDARNNSQLEAMSSDLINNSLIEGIQLQPQSVRSSIARRLGIEDAGLSSTDHYVEGLVDVMLDATNNCNNPLDAERLFNWHAALFPSGHSGMYRITVADWRKGDEPMQVVSGAFGKEKIHYQAPPSDAVPTMIEQFLHFVNSHQLPPLIMAAIAHLWFITIHPFDDGNGRISRTISDMILARMDNGLPKFYSISTEINSRKKSYYKILEHTQKGNLDITEWILWFIECFDAAITNSSAIITTTLRKNSYWQQFADTEINARQHKVINRLWEGFDGNLTTSKYAKICHCSQDTASRDISDLLAKGMLRNSGQHGRNTHYLLPTQFDPQP